MTKNRDRLQSASVVEVLDHGQCLGFLNARIQSDTRVKLGGIKSKHVPPQSN